MEITSIKLHRDKQSVEISFTRPNGSSKEQVKFPCKDIPSQTFMRAVEALDGDFDYLMNQRGENQPKVIGVHFGEKGGRATYQLTGGITVDAGFSSLNTPLLYEPGTELFKDAELTAEQVRRIEKVRSEAEKYVKGERTENRAMEEAEEEAEPVAT